MSTFSGSNNHHNIEIKEMPETSKIHKTESVNIQIPHIQKDNSNKEEGSFMTQDNKLNNNFPHDEDHELEKIPSNEFKDGPRINDQTESTMNIKSYSGFESLKDSIKRQSLISPGVEIQDLDIPLLDDQIVQDQMQHDNDIDPELDEDFDFDKEYYKTKEDLNMQNENHIFNQSHNSTMLMESVKDNQISHVWGNFN
jgi:hypothetical protein